MDTAKKTNVLFIMPRMEVGGAERVATTVLNNLNLDTFSPSLLLIKEADHKLLSKLTIDLPIHKLNVKGTLTFSIFNIVLTILRLKPDVVYIGMGDLGALLSPFTLLFKRFKWIVRETNTPSRRKPNAILDLLYKIFYRFYDCIIAQCCDMKNDLLNHYSIPPHKIKVINNPVDTDYIDNEIYNTINPGLSDDKINLVACGKLSKQKGFDLLIKQLSNIPNKNKYRLSIIGVGLDADPQNQEKELKNLVKENKLEDLVNLVGYKQDTYNWFKHADYFILSSRYEGFPNVLLEALACGTPVLANDCVGGINEIIDDGTNGYLFDFNKNNFAEKLNLIESTSFDPSQIKQNIKEKYGTRNIVYHFENLFASNKTP